MRRSSIIKLSFISTQTPQKMATTTTTIPMHIILTHILPKLPAKSLSLFKTVCKSWQSLISSHHFITHHLNTTLSTTTNNNHHLLILTSSFDHSLHLHSPHHLPITKLQLQTHLCIIGSCNGLLCLTTTSQRDGLILVVNPCTGISRNIPPLQLPRKPRAVNYAFGYDHVNDDYKLVRIMDYWARGGFFNDVSRQVHLFSSRDDKWKVIEWGVSYDRIKHGENGALIENNLVHWKVWCLEERMIKIRCFDLCVEKWVHDVPVPEYRESVGGEMSFDHLLYEGSDGDKRDEVLDLGVFDGCLFLSTKVIDQMSDATIGSIVFEVWVMKEYGVKESWTKLFRIGNASLVNSPRLAPVAYCNGGDRVLVRKGYRSGQKLFCYNVKDKCVEIAEFAGDGDFFWADFCIGSLVSVPGGQPFEVAKEEGEIDQVLAMFGAGHAQVARGCHWTQEPKL